MKTKLCQLLLALTASFSLVSCGSLQDIAHPLNAMAHLAQGNRHTSSGQWVRPGQSYNAFPRLNLNAPVRQVPNHPTYHKAAALAYYSSRPTPVSYVRSGVPAYTVVTHRSPQSRPASPYGTYHQSAGLITESPE